MFRNVPTLPAGPSAAPPDTAAHVGRLRAGQRWNTLVAAGTALCAGLFHATSWLWPGLGAGTWIGHTLLIALGAGQQPRAALVWGMLAGGVGIGASFSWGVSTLQSTLDASPAAALALFTVLVAVEAVPFGLTALTASLAARRGPAALWHVACVWTALEWLYPRLFGWRLAYSQLEWLPLVQVAELAGSTSIGFVMTAVAAIPAVLWKCARPSSSPAARRAACLYAWLAGGLLVATLGYGQVRLGQLERWLADQPQRTIGLVQTDPALVGSEEKLRSTSFAVHTTLDWLCWPETALGTYCETLGDFRDRDTVRRLSRDSYQSLQPAAGLACPLLAGGRLYGPQAGPEGPYAMAALLIGPDQTIWGKYRKRTLMPLGEYVPGQQWLPELRHWATIADELMPGDDPRPVVTARGERLGVLLCYEDTLPRHARETVACGAQFLVSLIQGTAFEHPRTLVQHQRLAVLRAVENRRYFARCASTGMTCLISPTGRVVGELPLFAEGVLRGRVVLIDHRTPYSHFGEWFPLACVLGLVAVGGRSVWRGYWACRK